MNNNNEQRQESTEESVKILERQLYHTDFERGRMIAALTVLVGMGLSIPTICPMLGATPDQVQEMLTFGVPMVAVGTPVALYKIHNLLSKRKELQEQLDNLKNDSQTEEKGMTL